MKNQKLKEALRELDKVHLNDLSQASAEEMYYSPEYEKKMNRLLGKKKEKTPFSWKTFGQRAGTFALGAAFALGIVAVIPKETPETVDEGTTWKYEAIDFVETSYLVHGSDPTQVAKENGYEKGTYEYEYLTLLSEISYYTAIAEYYVEKSSTVYDADSIMGGFLQTVSKEDIVAPYDAILFHACDLLNISGFAPAELTLDMLKEYWWSLPYGRNERNRGLVMSFTGLSFADVHEKLAENAEALLALREKYSDYMGDFYVNDYIRQSAEALIKACEPVYENKIEHTEAWMAYWASIEPTLEVTEEFIPELDVVKLTVTGNGIYRAPALSTRYITDVEFDIVPNFQGNDQKVMHAEKSFSIYMPVYWYFRGDTELSPIWITKYREHEYLVDLTESPFDDYYEYQLDPTEYYSDEAIEMNMESLDQLLCDIFGEGYSERDLLKVSRIELFNVDTPTLWLYVWEGETEKSYECKLIPGDYTPRNELKDKTYGDLPEKLAEDLQHFHALGIFQAFGWTDNLVSEDLVNDLNPYYVNG